MSGPASAPGLVHRFSIRAEVGPYRRVGDVVGGVLQVIPITGGTVTGAGLDGEVLDGGADWAVFRPDGSVLVEARYQIRTAAGTIIDILNTGLAGRPADGEEVPSYFPTSPTFRTDVEEHRWLLDSLFLGWARVTPEATTIEVFEVLAPPA
ncbi:Protein of unknown function [Klenkia marina]|uniref:UPF0311 protein SAMN03159343_0963 n=1 Tax=Klenkia marina TaxID=1960309 RepID=A0A1G4XH21_9ACTN|nr:Protein of unknown function [Klenkia marina]